MSISISNLTIQATDGGNVIIDGNQSNIFTVSEDYASFKGITFINANSIQGSCFYIWSRYVTVSDCDFINCHSSGNGGVLYIRNNFLTMNNCNFINCSALTGGALHLEGAQIFILNSNFINCSASQAGAINWHRKSSFLFNSTFFKLSCI